MDDFGFKLIDIDNSNNGLKKIIGNILVNELPKVIKTLTVVGTLAMLLVAGGIFIHNIHQLHDALYVMPNIIAELLLGFIISSVSIIFKITFKKIISKSR